MWILLGLIPILERCPDSDFRGHISIALGTKQSVLRCPDFRVSTFRGFHHTPFVVGVKHTVYANIELIASHI